MIKAAILAVKWPNYSILCAGRMFDMPALQGPAQRFVNKFNAGRWSLAVSCKYGNEPSGCSVKVGGNVKKAEAQNTFEWEKCMRPGTYCQLWSTIIKIYWSLSCLKTQTKASIFLQLPDGLPHLVYSDSELPYDNMKDIRCLAEFVVRETNPPQDIYRHNTIQDIMAILLCRNRGSVVQSQSPYSPRTVFPLVSPFKLRHQYSTLLWEKWS